MTKKVQTTIEESMEASESIWSSLISTLAFLTSIKGDVTLNCDTKMWDLMKTNHFVAPFDEDCLVYLTKMTQIASDTETIESVAEESGFPPQV